jgi:hypothetical protein
MVFLPQVKVETFAGWRTEMGFNEVSALADAHLIYS